MGRPFSSHYYVFYIHQLEELLHMYNLGYICHIAKITAYPNVVLLQRIVILQRLLYCKAISLHIIIRL